VRVAVGVRACVLACVRVCREFFWGGDKNTRSRDSDGRGAKGVCGVTTIQPKAKHVWEGGGVRA
jgi:hypothetical protein